MWYVYIDWTTEPTPRPFYVGKGTHTRVMLEERNYVHECVATCIGFTRHIALETHDEVEALRLEEVLIADFHTYVRDPDYNCIGCNLTRGGEGESGYHWSDEQRHNASIGHVRRWANPENVQKNREAQRIASARPEVKAKHRKNTIAFWQRPGSREMYQTTQRAGWQSAEAHQHGSDAVRKSWADPQSRERRLESFRSSETREKKRTAAKRVANDPAIQARRVATHKQTTGSSEWHAKHSALALEVQNRPEVKAKHSENAKASNRFCKRCGQYGHYLNHCRTV